MYSIIIRGVGDSRFSSEKKIIIARHGGNIIIIIIGFGSFIYFFTTK